MKRTRSSGELEFEVVDGVGSLGERAAGIIQAELKRKPDLLLCASAGGTPTGTYGALARQAARTPRQFGSLRILQIDEWAGLAPRHPATCDSDLRSKLLEPLQVSSDRYVGFKSHAADLDEECARVSRWVAESGPIDICILGLGINGHIAMNEPGPVAVPYPHVARLATSSQHHALLKDLHPKPRYGMTLGMADILRSRKILLLVSGAAKRLPLERLLQDLVTPQFPASFLWLHADATVLCDRAAAPNL